MPAIKIDKFLGEAPKVSSEQLPNNAAQTAYNVKISSGDLVPYRVPVVADNTERSVEAQTLYGIRDPSTDALDFLSWITDVDIVTASDSSDNEERFYYTGDGVPKVTTHSKATTGSEPYPVASFDLGLPLPETAPTATVTAFTALTTAQFARDSANTATIITGSAHGLRTGNVVSIRDFDDDDEAKSFNATNVFVTVLNATTFSYFNTGDAVTTHADTDGRVDLAGATQLREYVYTWITPWGEESIPSEPSAEVFLKEGQTVTVSNLPTAKPSGDNFVHGIRLYRTRVGNTTSDFVLSKELWWPISTARVSLTSNVATVQFATEHNLIAEDRFKIKSSSDATFNITDGIVVSVIDDLTITYAVTNADIADKAETSGVLLHDVAEVITDTARYWGDSDHNFTDDFLLEDLSEVLESTDYLAPKSTMKGLVMAHNEILVGFFDNQLCFSEPGNPHAWPLKYRLTLDYNIVGIDAIGGFILVLTEEYPYQVSGSDPDTMTMTRLDTFLPCVSKKSIVNMGYGIVFATYGGLAVYNPASGITLLTELIHDWDTWEDDLDASTLVGHFYNGKYFGSHASESFIFEKNDKIGGFLVSVKTRFSAAWNDPKDNEMYYTLGSTGDISKWDNESQILGDLEWKSKTIKTNDFMNLGAARVIADYTVTDAETIAIIVFNNNVPINNTAFMALSQQIAPINGPTDFGGSSRVEQKGTLNSRTINGDSGLMENLKTIPGLQPVQFQLFADKNLKTTVALTSDDVFRLPTGYKSDTWEVAVSGSARIRAIHVGETPFGLNQTGAGG